jgi:hypothetical protein
MGRKLKKEEKEQTEWEVEKIIGELHYYYLQNTAFK